MSRRRSLPWIHRWSRLIIGAISMVGAVLTAYLTTVKLSGSQLACIGTTASGADCNTVINSRYGEIFGLPVSLFGLLAYISMAIFALSPLLVNRDTNKTLRNNLENTTWLLLLAGATSMTIFSGYLMSVLVLDIKGFCAYCLGSALLALSLLVVTLLGRSWEDLGQIFFIGIIVGFITLMGTFAVYANNAQESTLVDGKVPITRPDTAPEPPAGWKITTVSGPAEIALAKHLTSIGAKEYGAFWCPHCFEQKQLFGAEAFSQITYVECDPQGKNPNPEACKKAGVQGFPSWEIKGKLYPGTQTLEELAKLSEYSGPMDFKYTLKRS